MWGEFEEEGEMEHGTSILYGTAVNLATGRREAVVFGPYRSVSAEDEVAEAAAGFKVRIPKHAGYDDGVLYEMLPGVTLSDYYSEEWGWFENRKKDWLDRMERWMLPQLREIRAFDHAIGNSDRHALNIMVDATTRKLYCIDNSECYGDSHYERVIIPPSPKTCRCGPYDEEYGEEEVHW